MGGILAVFLLTARVGVAEVVLGLASWDQAKPDPSTTPMPSRPSPDPAGHVDLFGVGGDAVAVQDRVGGHQQRDA
jgi:hypothetical protein